MRQTWRGVRRSAVIWSWKVFTAVIYASVGACASWRPCSPGAGLRGRLFVAANVLYANDRKSGKVKVAASSVLGGTVAAQRAVCSKGVRHGPLEYFWPDAKAAAEGCSKNSFANSAYALAMLSCADIASQTSQSS